MRQILTIMMLSLLPALAIAAPWDSDSIASIFAGRLPDPIEGVWQFPADGATLLIEKKTASTYEILLLESPSLDVRPGTPIGTAVTTPTDGTYDAHLDSKRLGNKRLKKADAALTIIDGHLCFKPYSTGKRVAFWRWVPYIFRVGVFNNNTRPANLDGADKIYPVDEANLKPCL